jgi:predicted ATP-dependent endonuclease of OLD family
MKITGIEIDEYRQFKNIKFDFTYPEGHDKAGQPLEKVCFIGQSATGKTTLLNIVWEFVSALSNATKSHDGQPGTIAIENFANDYNLSEVLKAISFDISVQEDRIRFSRIEEEHLSDKDFVSKWFRSFSRDALEQFFTTDKLCLFIKDSISSEAAAFLTDQNDQPNNFSDYVKTDAQVSQDKFRREMRIEFAGFQRNILLGDMQSITIWQYLLKDIEDYDYLTVKRVTDIIQNTPKNKLAEKLQEWVESDPRIKLGTECLNPILSQFYLEVDDNDKGKVPISLRTKKGVSIPGLYLSTGTRQILSTAIPLYKFKTKDTVILFDEPERSLFPDIQRELIKYYSSLAPQAQFFYATHSPIIASSFDPCERFVLYFDRNGDVGFHRGVAPEGDDPNDILRQDFNMKELMLEKGIEAYQYYLNLTTKIINESNIERKMKMIAERSIIGNKYNFPQTGTNEAN